jgi:hypothetical protein
MIVLQVFNFVKEGRVEAVELALELLVLSVQLRQLQLQILHFVLL